MTPTEMSAHELCTDNKEWLYLTHKKGSEVELWQLHRTKIHCFRWMVYGMPPAISNDLAPLSTRSVQTASQMPGRSQWPLPPSNAPAPAPTQTVEHRSGRIKYTSASETPSTSQQMHLIHKRSVIENRKIDKLSIHLLNR